MRENKRLQKQLWRGLTIISNQQNNKPIGFFDSGVGGLTVLSDFRKVLPSENIIFFGDTKNMPYGEKTKEQLIDYSSKAFSFFQSKGVKAVVMACNTTSAVVYDVLKDKYDFKIYPLIQSVAKIIGNLPCKNLGVFATPATTNSHAYKYHINKINSNINIIEIACPEWVKIVENKEENTEYAIKCVKSKIEEMMKFSPDKIILGCTHYPYLTNILSKYTDKKLYINPAKAFVEYIKKDLTDNGLLNTNSIIGKDDIYVSAAPKKFIEAAKMFYEVNNVNLID